MDNSNVNSKGVMPCSGLEMEVGSGHEGVTPSLHCSSECAPWLGQGKTTGVASIPVGV